MPVVRNDHLRSKGHELSGESPWDFEFRVTESIVCIYTSLWL